MKKLIFILLSVVLLSSCDTVDTNTTIYEADVDYSTIAKAKDLIEQGDTITCVFVADDYYEYAVVSVKDKSDKVDVIKKWNIDNRTDNLTLLIFGMLLGIWLSVLISVLTD